jgi:hypothetical protein
MSDDQWECAQMFADVVGGFHHVTGTFKPWNDGIRVSDYQRAWSTFDMDRLTRLVILAHDRMIRVSIVPSAPRRVGIEMWKRHTREGRMSKRHPTMEQAIATHRRSKTDD